MSEIQVRCHALTKCFSDTCAVQNLHLEIPRGRIVAVLGPSGCGKTTLLRLIAGFEIPDEGAIEIHGRTVAGRRVFVPPERRRVGMVFQDHALFPHLTVGANVAFGLGSKGREESRSRVHHLLTMVGLAGLADRYPHELSGGESQRVALARALAPEPAILLMDEPFSNLDADRRGRLRDEIRFILKQTETTALFVTHDQEEALFMGDLLAVMQRGHLVQLGRPEAVFQTPATTSIAEFLGNAEFLPAQVTRGGIETELGVLPQAVDLPMGAQLEVAFRADDVTFDPDRTGGDMVLARLFQGAVTTYRLRLESGRIIHSLQPHYLNLRPGTIVRARFEANHPLPCFQDGRALQVQELDSRVLKG